MIDELTICVYNSGSKGKKVARRNGRRITLREFNSLVAGKVPVKKFTCEGYTRLYYEVDNSK